MPLRALLNVAYVAIIEYMDKDARKEFDEELAAPIVVTRRAGPPAPQLPAGTTPKQQREAAARLRALFMMPQAETG